MKKIIQFFQALKIIFQLGSEKIVKLQEEAIRLREEAIRDPLTGLYNRRFLDEVGPKEVARANRYGHPFSLLSFDLDDLKKFNDLYGHQMGDEVLKEVAKVLRDHCRKSDFAFRVGGDEFLFLLSETSEEGAKEVSRRIISKLEAEDIHLSYGLVLWKKDFDSFEDLRIEADRRMYHQKEEKGLKR